MLPRGGDKSALCSRTAPVLLPASKHGPRISRWKLNSYSKGLVTSLSSS